MRSIRPLAWVALGALALAPPAAAKFGMSKTKVTLRRTRPPEIPLLGETVSVDVTSRARSVSDRHLDVVRRRVQDAVSADKSMRLVEAKAADNVVRVEVDGLEARVDDNTIYEEHYVKIGERQEWDDKKKKMVTKDVYGNRQEPVRLRKEIASLSELLDAAVDPEERARVWRDLFDRQLRLELLRRHR